MFLVILRSYGGDLPLFWSSSESKAIKYARHADWIPDDRISELFHCDGSSPMCIGVMEFRAGKPWNWSVIRQAKDEDDGDISPPGLDSPVRLHVPEEQG